LERCPYCGTEAVSTKQWRYHNNYYVVKAFTCQNCTLTFRAYYHESKFSHTIPKSPDDKTRIKKYLKAHTQATKEEISSVFNLDLIDVLRLLLQMQKEGVVYSLQSEQETEKKNRKF
jgi:hypothetical protein